MPEYENTTEFRKNLTQVVNEIVTDSTIFNSLPTIGEELADPAKVNNNIGRPRKGHLSKDPEGRSIPTDFRFGYSRGVYAKAVRECATLAWKIYKRTAEVSRERFMQDLQLDINRTTELKANLEYLIEDDRPEHLYPVLHRHAHRIALMALPDYGASPMSEFEQMQESGQEDIFGDNIDGPIIQPEPFGISPQVVAEVDLIERTWQTFNKMRDLSKDRSSRLQPAR